MSFFGLIFVLLIFAGLFLIALTANIISIIIEGCRSILQALGLIEKDKQQKRTYRQQTTQHASQSSNPVSNGKIFGADEGEYVDFEEIKN